jgi:hypothetical protein
MYSEINPFFQVTQFPIIPINYKHSSTHNDETEIEMMF